MTDSTPPLREWLDERTGAERATIAQLWHAPPAAAQSPEALADALLQPAAVTQLLERLSPPERAALARVQAEGGSIAAPVLERDYGRVRPAGAYPNPRAYLLALEQPPAPVERLWLLALLHSTTEHAERRYTIWPDLLPLLPPVPLRDRSLALTPAPAPPQVYKSEGSDLERNLLLLLTLAYDGQLEVIPTGGLNKASLLKLARAFDPKEKLQGVSREEQWPYIRFVRQLAEGMELLRAGADSRLRPTRAALEWMRAPQVERARQVLNGWIASPWDELDSFVGLKLQRAYGRNLAATKRAMMRLIAQAPPEHWISLDDFVAAVKESEPDFARPDGRYDAWGILNYMRQPIDGWEFWDAVEGEQLRGVAGGTLRWLGLADLGMDGEEPVSFRVNALGAALLHGAPVLPESAVEPLIVQPNFEVIVPRNAALDARFQIGRIAERTSVAGEDTQIYKLTKRRVQAALERDIAADDMLRFLAEASGPALPQNVAATLREWAGQHGQVSLRHAAVLEARDAALLEQIKRDKRVRLGVVEHIADTAWLVRPGNAPALAERLRKAGYGLAADVASADGPLRDNDLTVLFAALDFYERACQAVGVESEASGAMRQRVGKLLSETQLNRAYQTSHRALQRLKERLGENE